MNKAKLTKVSVKPGVVCPKCKSVGTLQHIVFTKVLQHSVYQVVQDEHGNWDDGDEIDNGMDDGNPDGDCFHCPKCETDFSLDDETGKFLELDMWFHPIPGKEFERVNLSRGSKTEPSSNHQFWD